MRADLVFRQWDGFYIDNINMATVLSQFSITSMADSVRAQGSSSSPRRSILV